MVNNQEYLNAWGSIDSEEETKPKQQEQLDYLKVDIGATKIRILDMIPFSYKEWWAPRGNGGKGCSVPYFGSQDLMEAENRAFMEEVFAEADKRNLKGKERRDFLRDHGYKKQPWGRPREKHIIHVLERATGQVKLLDKGNAIFKRLKKLALDPEYGDLRQYDVTINMSGDKRDFQSIEYDVVPARQNTPLTEAEKTLYEEKKVDLSKLKGPKTMTPEQAYMIAKGATYEDTFKKGNNKREELEAKTSEDMLPEEPATKPVVSKGEPLTDEELNNIEF